MTDPVKIILSKVARELGISYADAERAYRAPFELQSIIMRYRCDREKQIFPSLRIPYFLIFFCPPWKKEQFKKLQKKNEASGSGE